MQSNNVQYQLTPPGVHRTNCAERAIKTAKAHIISGLCSVDPQFPMHQWDQLLEQAEITLNMLRGSRINQKLSAYTQINGIFNPSATPLGPPGCLVLAHEKPTQRSTWAPHGKEAFYLGPALESYRSFKVYIPETRGIRTIDTISWFPRNLVMPIMTDTDILHNATQEILQVLQAPTKNANLAHMSPTEFEAIKKLVTILQNSHTHSKTLSPNETGKYF
jgi:hypothetical protein